MPRKVVQLYTFKELLKTSNNKLSIDEHGNIEHAQGAFVLFNDFLHLLGEAIYVSDIEGRDYYYNSEQPIEPWLIKKDFSEEA